MQKILIVSDGKPGHLNQSLGLVEAIERLTGPVDVEQAAPLSWWTWLQTGIGCLLGRRPASPVSLLVGAGHRTHLTLLLLGWVHSARTLVLMKPSLPLGWFDLCIIPEHDQPPASAHVVETQGALNRMQPGKKLPESGLILLGGPSRHYDWDEPALLSRVQALLHALPEVRWEVATSRRTPASTEALLQEKYPQLTLMPARELPASWLPEKLAVTAHCWVTEDSVSMIYEALTAGCQTGLLELPERSHSRVQRGIARLKASGWVQLPGGDPALLVPLAEADRCAALLAKRGWI